MLPQDVCDDSVARPVFRLTRTDPDALARAHQPLTINIDSSAAGDPGVMLPIEVTISSGSSEQSYQRQVFRRVVPSVVTFYPREGGPHLVRVAELYHQRYAGTLEVDVAGERLDARTL